MQLFSVRTRACALLLSAITITSCAVPTADKGEPGDWAAATTQQSVVERGRYLVHGPAHCADCHAAPDAARDAATLGGGRVFELGPLGRFVAANLSSDPDAGLGRWSDAEIARVVRHGRTRDGRRIAPLMQFEQLTDADVRAIVSYLRTLPPSPRQVPRSEPSLVGRVLLAAGFMASHAPLPAGAPDGQYLAEAVANCDACHTRRSLVTGRQIGPAYAGGMRIPEGGREFVTPDISRTGTAGRLDADQFVALFRAGRHRPPGSPMPWHAYAAMTDDDLKAIHRHLRRYPEPPAGRSASRGTATATMVAADSPRRRQEPLAQRCWRLAGLPRL